MEQKSVIKDNFEFRIGRISPVEMLTISSAGISLYKKGPDGNFTLDFSNEKNVETINTFYNMVFEHIEVKVADKWNPVKQKGTEVWWPESIVTNYDLLMDLINWFMSEVVFPVFLKSSESTKKSDSLDQKKVTSKPANGKE